MSANSRGKLLYKLADLIEKNSEELATLETYNNGMTYGFANYVSLPMIVYAFRYYAGWCDKIEGRTIPIEGIIYLLKFKDLISVIQERNPWEYVVKLYHGMFH